MYVISCLPPPRFGALLALGVVVLLAGAGHAQTQPQPHEAGSSLAWFDGSGPEFKALCNQRATGTVPGAPVSHAAKCSEPELKFGSTSASINGDGAIRVYAAVAPGEIGMRIPHRGSLASATGAYYRDRLQVRSSGGAAPAEALMHVAVDGALLVRSGYIREACTNTTNCTLSTNGALFPADFRIALLSQGSTPGTGREWDMTMDYVAISTANGTQVTGTYKPGWTRTGVTNEATFSGIVTLRVPLIDGSNAFALQMHAWAAMQWTKANATMPDTGDFFGYSKSDFSHTMRITAVEVLDASGRNITGSSTIKFDSGLEVTAGPAQGLTILVDEWPVAKQGVMYEAQLDVIGGGESTVVWRVASGSLPPGLNLESAGVIRGVPAGSGAYTATIVAEAGARRGERTLRWSVGEAFRITSDSVPRPATMGAAYGDTLRTGGGGETPTWSVTAGKLPVGLTLDASTGRIAGVAEEAGTFRFTARAGAGALLASKEFILQVNKPVLQPAAILDQLLGAGTLSTEQLRFLDLIGNRNGRLDVGDVRAWLLDNQHLTSSQMQTLRGLVEAQADTTSEPEPPPTPTEEP